MKHRNSIALQISQNCDKYLHMFYTKDNLQGNPAVISVGEFSYGSPRVVSWEGGAKLIIGNFCSFADEVTIFTGGNHRVEWISTYPFSALNKRWPEGQHITGDPSSKGNVIIGNDVWIGHGALIMSGVTIGDGAVIGAKAVVAKDVAPYSIVVGNPATVIKKRFNDSDIEVLSQLKWWDWPLGDIKAATTYLYSSNIQGLVGYERKNTNATPLVGRKSLQNNAIYRRFYNFAVSSRLVKRVFYIKHMLFNKIFI